MKYHDTFATIRLFALILGVLLIAAMLDAKINEQPPEEPIIIEIEEPTPPPEPIEEPEPDPLPEPEETWTSLGTYTLTAYCSCKKCCGYWATVRPLDAKGNPIVYTSTGEIAQAGTTIAVDPNKIPYGTKVKINDHIYIAQDIGGAIKGNRIDVYHDNHQDALVFGRQQSEAFTLNAL